MYVISLRALGFFALALTVVQFGVLWFAREMGASPDYALFCAAILVGLIVIVAGVLFCVRPELAGPDMESLGSKLGQEIFTAFDRYMTNMKKSEIEDAYLDALDLLTATGRDLQARVRRAICASLRSRLQKRGRIRDQEPEEHS